MNICNKGPGMSILDNMEVSTRTNVTISFGLFTLL